MSARRRTDEWPRRRVSGAVAVAGLGAVAGVHVAWAAGSTWPVDDRRALADLVFGPTGPAGGQGRFPGAGPTLAVAGLLTIAAGSVAATSGLVDPPGGPTGARLARASARAAAGVLLLRGVGGLVVSVLDLRPVTPQFRRWDLSLYSPLALGLGVAAARASSGH